MAKLFANSRDPDQMPHSAASDLGLHCLPITLLQVSRLQWVNNLINQHLFFFYIFIHTLIKTTWYNILLIINLVAFVHDGFEPNFTIAMLDKLRLHAHF